MTLQNGAETVKEAVEGLAVIISIVHADEHYAEVVQHIDYLAM